MIALFIHRLTFHCSAFLLVVAERTNEVIKSIHPDLRSILLLLLISSSISLFRNRYFVKSYYKSPFALSFLLLTFLLVTNILYFTTFVAYCDGRQAFSPALSPIEVPAQPEPLPLQQPIIPILPQPLLSDETRRSILYQRYSLLNWGRSTDLGRMVSIIDAQVRVERYVESALVADGFNPNSILFRMNEIRGLIHSPQGELLSVRTYRSYVTHILENGTRESVPYRRIMRALQNFDLFL